MTPTWCTNKLEYSAPGLESWLQWNEGTQTFTFPQITDDLSLAGLTETTYEVSTSFTTTDYTGAETPYTQKFDLTIKNPCIDQEFVRILAPTLAKKTYIIDSEPFTFDPEGEFTVETEPVVGHTLCGDFKFVAKFANQVVTGDPLSYNDATREFTADSEDGNLLTDPEQPYSIEVEFLTYPLSTYPTVDTASAASTIEFINPCLKPFKFEPREQTNPSHDEFTGEDIVFTLTEFELTPARCEASYRCTSVERLDQAASSLSCSDLTFDGVFDGQDTDGTLTFSADSQDYINDTFTPGVYTVTITGTAVGSSPLLEQTATFFLIL